MKQKLILFAAVLVAVTGYTKPCEYDKSNPALPVADCQFKACLEGADCVVPTILKDSARMEFQDPVVIWQPQCQGDPAASSCWEARFKLRFRLKATDASGISQIGVNLAQEISARRSFKKYFEAAAHQDATGAYDVTINATIYVPPGQRLTLSVYEVCARDTYNNEACVTPTTSSGVKVSMGNSSESSTEKSE